MSFITKTDWNDWKQDKVTKAFYGAAFERVEDAKDILSVSAGLDSDENNFYRGFIAAYREMAEFKVDDLVDD